MESRGHQRRKKHLSPKNEGKERKRKTEEEEEISGCLLQEKEKGRGREIE